MTVRRSMFVGPLRQPGRPGTAARVAAREGATRWAGAAGFEPGSGNDGVQGK
jgi:hypothetical protein